MRNWSFIIAIVLILHVPNWLLAQNKSISEIWKQAEGAAKAKNWSEARLIIRPHLFPPPEDSLTPWLLQLYALACEFENDPPSVIATTQNIIEKYPDWRGIDETRFLLAMVLLQQNRVSKAWDYLRVLPERYVADSEQAIRQKRIHIHKDSVAVLAQLPGFDLCPLSSLFNTAQIKDVGLPTDKRPVPKIGVVFPFNFQAVKKSKVENPAVDYYRGILFASEVLAAADSAIEVHVFDGKNDEVSIAKMQKDNAFGGLNLILGPIRSNQISALAKAAGNNSIPVINPLSSHVPNEQGNDFFMQEPSNQIVANQCFNFVTPYSIGKKVGIVYGPEKNDSLLAETYKELMKKMGREVVLFKKVGKNSAANMTKFLVDSGLDSTSHLFVPNNEPLVRVQLLSAYSWIKGKFPIIVYGKWLESSNIDYDELAKHPIYFLNPDLPDRTNSHWHEWASSYASKWGTPPSWIAWKGFDLMCAFSRSWYRFGADWINEWKTGKLIESPLFGAYQYSPLFPGNRYLPVYKVDETGIVKVWPQ